MKRSPLLPIITSALLLLLCLSSFYPQASGASGSTICDAKCKVRCSKAGMKERCLKYCGVCCNRCNCVPSGTFGNKDECPCYRDMLSSKKTSKCP